MSGSVSMVDGHVDPDKNRLTDKEIIKALECCDGSFDKCGECPLDSVNQDKLRCWELEKSALELINRQQAKIKALQMDNEQLETDNFNANMNCEHLRAELERLKPLEESLDKLLYLLNAVDMGMSVLQQKHTIKAEAIKEFAGKIADVFCSHDKGDAYVREVVYNLVKEMAGEDK